MSDFDSVASTPVPAIERPHKRRRVYDDSEQSTPRYSSPDEVEELRSGRNSTPPRRSTSTEVRTPSRDKLDRSYLDRSRSPSSSPDTPRSSASLHTPEAASSPTYKPLKVRYKQKLILRGHRKGVSQVRFSPDGRWIASCSADGTIKIWDAITGKHMRTLEGHLAGVSTIAWSPDSKSLASGSDDKTIRLWDRATGKPYPAPLLGHHNYVYSLAFSPKGNMLASGSYDEAVFLWDLRARRQMRSLPAHSDPVVHEDNPPVTTVRFSPNGKYILAFTLDSCVRLWDYISGTCKKTYQGHRNLKYALGGTFGYGVGSQEDEAEAFIVSGSEDGDIFFWDAKTKEVIQRVSGHEGVVCWVDTSPGPGGTVVSGGLDGTVRVWVDVPEEDQQENTTKSNTLATNLDCQTNGYEKADKEMPDVKIEEDNDPAKALYDTDSQGENKDLKEQSPERNGEESFVLSHEAMDED
ncbi:hypothetical protein B7463_g5038, partial [Scytalidium lignicola]